jgi:hypothetical protein
MRQKSIYLILAVYPLIRTTEFGSCVAYALGGFRQIEDDRTERFLGKVQESTARCRGGEATVKWLTTPWVDWQTSAGLPV